MQSLEPGTYLFRGFCELDYHNRPHVFVLPTFLDSPHTSHPRGMRGMAVANDSHRPNLFQTILPPPLPIIFAFMLRGAASACLCGLFEHGRRCSECALLQVYI